MRAWLAGAALLLVAADRPPPERLASLLTGRTAEAPEECLDLTGVQAPLVIDERTIVYRRNARRLYVTGPSGRCQGLQPGATLVVEPTAGRLCRQERFRPLLPGTAIPAGVCRFGAFVLWERAAR